jgi:purine-binding chemotaxis protein CheW
MRSTVLLACGEETGPGMATIDWDAVWRSLEWDNRGRTDAEQILAQRTEKYARPPGQEAALRELLSVLVFTRGKERYGIPIEHVLHGVSEPSITPLPCVPPFYQGVIALRGQILTVLDLPRLWGLPVGKDPPAPRLIVVTLGALTLAIQADDVHALAEIPLAAVVPAVTAGVGLAHVQGLSPDGIVIVDMDSLADDPRLLVHDAR